MRARRLILLTGLLGVVLSLGCGGTAMEPVPEGTGAGAPPPPNASASANALPPPPDPIALPHTETESSGGSSRGGGKASVHGATATSTGDGIPPVIIESIVNKELDRVRGCYEKAIVRDPTLAGRVAVQFTIDAKGAVPQASASDTNIADAAMISCVVSVVRSLSFPAPDKGGMMIVTYPFHFDSGDK